MNRLTLQDFCIYLFSDLMRMRQREGIAKSPLDAKLHHALGLSLGRQGKRDEALRELKLATAGPGQLALLLRLRRGAQRTAARESEAVKCGNCKERGAVDG